jgi:hypothetical protein
VLLDFLGNPYDHTSSVASAVDGCECYWGNAISRVTVVFELDTAIPNPEAPPLYPCRRTPRAHVQA